MRYIVQFLLIVVVAFTAVSSAQAQKFGHINSTELLELMPQRDSAETKLGVFAKELETRMLTMQNEYRTKVNEYETNQATWSQLILADKVEEIKGIEARLTEFQQKAQTEIQKKETELLTPIIDMAKKAIEKVSRDNNYTYVFDTGVGVLLHFPEGDNILPLVKKELGLL